MTNCTQTTRAQLQKDTGNKRTETESSKFPNLGDEVIESARDNACDACALSSHSQLAVYGV